MRQDIDGVIADGLSSGRLAVLAVAEADTDAFLGSIVLFEVRGDRAEVGFWLTPGARGRGAAEAALDLATDLAAELGLDRLEARTAPENRASQRVLENAGFVLVGGPRAGTAPSGEQVVLLDYARATMAPAGDQQ